VQRFIFYLPECFLVFFSHSRAFIKA